MEASSRLTKIIFLLLIATGLAYPSELLVSQGIGSPTNGNVSFNISTTSSCLPIIYSRDYPNNISAGKWYVTLGQEGDLTLNASQHYWIAYSTNGTAKVFVNNTGGSSYCQEFQSPVGAVNASLILNAFWLTISQAATESALQNASLLNLSENKSGIGNCTNGTAVQNLTAGQPQCVNLSSGPQGSPGIPGTNGTAGTNGTNGTDGVNGSNFVNITGSLNPTAGYYAYPFNSSEIRTAPLSTDNVSEGANLYFTQARAITAISNATYTRTQTENLANLTYYLTAAQTYTRTQIEGLANLTYYLTATNTYTRSQIEGLANLTNYMTSATINTLFGTQTAALNTTMTAESTAQNLTMAGIQFNLSSLGNWTADKVNYYTRSQVEGLANLTYYLTATNTYTRSQIEGLANLTNYLTSTQTYTRAQIEGLNNLTNYLLSTATYTRTQIEGLQNMTYYLTSSTVYSLFTNQTTAINNTMNAESSAQNLTIAGVQTNVSLVNASIDNATIARTNKANIFNANQTINSTYAIVFNSTSYAIYYNGSCLVIGNSSGGICII